MNDVEFKVVERAYGNELFPYLLTIVTLVAVVFVWSAVTELDNVVRGAGKPFRSPNQLVQSSEPGVIRKRYFGEGDYVLKEIFYLILTQ